MLWCVGMSLLVQNLNHCTTAKAVYSVAQEREVEGMLCRWKLPFSGIFYEG